jgi:hypothetical protein
MELLPPRKKGRKRERERECVCFVKMGGEEAKEELLVNPATSIRYGSIGCLL